MPSLYHDFLGRVPPQEADPGAKLLTRSFNGLGRIDTIDRRTIAVTHNLVIGWIVREVLDAPWWRWIGLNQANGAISRVKWSTDGETRLHFFNERGHLQGPDK